MMRAVVVWSWAWVLMAAAPPYLPVQGVLTDASGAPLSTDVTVTFGLYTAAVDGTAAWSETQTVAVRAGAFAVYLGQVTPLPLTLFRDQGALWLGVRVGMDSEMARVLLGSQPFAGYSEYAGATCSEVFACTTPTDSFCSAITGHACGFDNTGSGGGTALPAGMISMFDGACPTGWTRVAALDGRTVRGAAAYNPAAGGADTHTHAVDPASVNSDSVADHGHSVDPASVTTSAVGDHRHHTDIGSFTTGTVGDHQHVQTAGAGIQGGTGGGVKPAEDGFFTTSNGGHSHSADPPGQNSDDQGGHDHSVNVAATASSAAGGHNHSVDVGATASSGASSWPPFADIVFCRKD